MSMRRRTDRRSESHDAYLKLVKAEHDHLMHSLAELRKLDIHTPATLRDAMQDRIEAELALLRLTETRLLYPAAQVFFSDPWLVDALRREHENLQSLLRELRQIPISDARWSVAASVLSNYLNHHVSGEEEMLDALEETELDWQRLLQQTLSMRFDFQQRLSGCASGRDRRRESARASLDPMANRVGSALM